MQYKTTSVEDIIADSARRIVDDDDNYHKASVRSEMAYLISIIRSLLVVEITKLREAEEWDENY
tara:strand:+ start:2653 stop:2844 length:192 start_codon:yes stop_codon:yes gene_type:complete